MANTTVFMDGSVYSPVDPYATALVFSDSMVEWVGSDAGAQSIYDDTMNKVKLEGELLTPAFVHGGCFVSSQVELERFIDTLLNRGYSAATIFVPPHFSRDAFQLAAKKNFKLYPYIRIKNLTDFEVLSTDIYGVQVVGESRHLQDLIQSTLSSQKKLSFIAVNPQEIATFCQELARLTDAQRAHLAPRIDGLQGLSIELNEVCKELGIALGFSSYLQNNNSIAHAVSSGAHIFLGSDPHESSRLLGWELALEYVVRSQPQQQISARATFNALTRGIYRALGETNPFYGQLAPQSPADIARWKVTELMVQTANDSVAAWSTDPRARIPLLPALEIGKLPVLNGLFIAGQVAIEAS
ncbi:hypothetical protein [uncultured Rothia sp.]|uniref:hypothetical protein n=1 Tax=uncultured Rothia sp. TaxID=316088 RepID=UPI00321633AA